MRNKLAPLAGMLCLATGSAMAQPTGEGTPARPPIEFSTQLPGDVTMYGDVTYASRTGFRPLTMDIYKPNKSGPLPAVITVHGGGWRAGTPRTSDIIGYDWPTVLAGLAERGFVIFAVSYRLSEEAKFPAPVHDVRSAIRWVRSNAERYDVDPGKIVLWGGSAGAQIVNMVALTCSDPSFDAPDAPAEPGVCVSGVVDWYGPTDFMNIGEDGSVIPWGTPEGLDISYLGCSSAPCPVETLRRASPVQFVSSSAPPFLIAHGTADTVVSLKQSERLQAALLEKGVEVELKIVPGGEHRFTGAAQSEINAALTRTFDFIEEVIE